ncbi:MAG: DUF4864 domain-containing protein [Geminicoccaceae bacterium]|nr:DUF4864 domain-containing protein [Geminicoccaceae bacterium]
MRRLAFTVLALIVFSSVHPARAADAPAIRAVIEAQLKAFRSDDGAAAFAKASPGIQAMFGTPENFMAMVRQGYPQVYRPRAVEFADIVTERGRPVQRVRIVGPDGKVVMAHYPMQRQPDGSWRIDGCYLEELPEVAV